MNESIRETRLDEELNDEALDRTELARFSRCSARACYVNTV